MNLTMKRVMVVVAHPDDEVLGCGSMVQKILHEGGSVRIMIMGEGSSCRFPRHQIDSEEVKNVIQQRRSFADKALTVLGVKDAVFGDLPCGRFDSIPIIDIGKRIEEQIADFQPDTIISHFNNDANSDHRLTINAVIAATRPVPEACVKTVLSCEIPSSTEWRFVETFKPNFFVNADSYIDKKIKAFDYYFPTEGREFPFPRSEEGILTLARYRGMQVGLNYAEAFEIVRSISS
jgi:LmbE family N-acetylglucosaminyl deacetylase